MTTLRRTSPLPSCPKHPGFLEGKCIACQIVVDVKEHNARVGRGIKAVNIFEQRAQKQKKETK